MVLALLVLDAAAIFGWLALLKRFGRETIRRGNWKLPLAFLGAGALSAGGVVMVGFSLRWIIGYSGPGSVGGLFIDEVFLTGLVEEGCKFFCFTLFYRSWAPKKDPRDGMVLAAMTALGFSGIENFLYGLNYGVGILILRTFTSTLSHISYAGLWGYIYSSLGSPAAEIMEEKKKRQLLFNILLLSAILHGLSNVFLSARLNGANIFLKVLSLLPAFLAYRYIGRVFAGQVKEPDKQPPVRRLSKAELYRRHYRAACVSVSRRKYDRAMDHIAYCRRHKKNDLFLLFLEGVCLYALGRKFQGYGAMATALTDMDRASIQRISSSLPKLVTEKELRKEVKRVIEEG
ncbi:MAG: PrsW family intramembrane metalloprotease [Spirochaetales bacterium]|nr:PrsW family intramembrane metalloprotease [Spirochaetales bacterium]